MQKLVLILLAFFAVFTFIRAFDTAEAQVAENGVIQSTSMRSPDAERLNTAISAEVSTEIPVEITR